MLSIHVSMRQNWWKGAKYSFEHTAIIWNYSRSLFLKATILAVISLFRKGNSTRKITLRLCLSYYVLRPSPHNHRVCAVLFSRPLLSLYACVCHVLLCVLAHKHRVFECFFLGLPFLKRLYSYVCHVLLCVFSLHQVCSVPFPRPPVKFVRLFLSC